MRWLDIFFSYNIKLCHLIYSYRAIAIYSLAYNNNNNLDFLYNYGKMRVGMSRSYG